MHSTLRLSGEELALALSLSGFDQLAHSLLVSSFGDALTPDTIQGKLTAASHSLLGQRLLALQESGNFLLSPALEEVVTVMTAAQRTIRFSLSSAQGSRLLSYHFAAKGVYEHWVEEGVVHVITLVDQTAIVQACPVFFDIARYKQAPHLAGVVAESLLRQALQSTDPEAAERVLSEAQLTEQIRKQLSEDVARTGAIGDVLDIRYGADGSPAADDGLTLIFGRYRFWLMKPEQHETGVQLILLPATSAAFQEAVQMLVARGTSFNL